MKAIGNFLNRKNIAASKSLDEKSIFYIFDIIIKEEYGRQGTKNISPVVYRGREIFVRVAKEFWGEEITQNKRALIERVNGQLGSNEIRDLSVVN